MNNGSSRGCGSTALKSVSKMLGALPARGGVRVSFFLSGLFLDICPQCVVYGSP